MYSILIVEDEKKMAESLIKGLGKHEFKTTLVTNGVEARLQDIDDYDAVILDWMLPGFPGIEVLHFWRMQGKKTPILMLTAKDQVNDIVTGLDFGADDYMSKFFEWEELIARLNVLIRRGVENQTTVGPVKFDRVAKQFFEKTKPIALTKTEYKVLSYLFDHPTRIVTKDILIDSLWNIDSTPDSNVIERHIKEIRKKIKHDLIETIHGMGYRLRSK
jgi:two-component system, OmpR family, response regulator